MARRTTTPSFFTASVVAIASFLAACGIPHPLRTPPMITYDVRAKTSASPPPPRQDDHNNEASSFTVAPFAGGVRVGRVVIETEGHATEKEAKRFRDALVKQLETRFPQTDKTVEPTRVDIHYRTTFVYRFDILTFYTIATLGLFPLGIQEGDTRTSATLVIHPPKNPQSDERLNAFGYRPFVIVLYPWFRSAPIDEAFAKTHRRTIKDIERRLRFWAKRRKTRPLRTANVRRARGPSPFNRQPQKGHIVFDFDDKGAVQTKMDTRSFRIIGDDQVYAVAKKATTTAGPSFWRRYLGALSGLEGGAFFGTAWVHSTAKDPQTQENFTIASGKARSRGWKIDFYTPPTETGPFIFPTLGFFSLDIDIADVAGDIPLGAVPGAHDIAAVGSNPVTGKVIDLGAPNRYALRLRSGYLGQRVGSNLVYGNAKFQFFATGQVGLNIFE